MRTIAFTAFLAVIAFHSAAPELSAQSSAPPAAASEAAVLVEGLRVGSQSAVSAQGFFVGPDTLATAWHVCAWQNPMWVNLGPRGCFPVDSVIAEDEAADVILLHVKDVPADVPVLKLRADVPILGEELFLVRRTDDGRPKFTMIDFRRLYDAYVVPSIHVSGNIHQGYSGAAVVGEDGAVVGLASGGYPDPDAESKLAPAWTLAHLLSTASPQKRERVSVWRLRTFGGNEDMFLSVLDEAQGAYHKGENARSLDLSRKALELNPRSFSALRYADGAMQLLGKSHQDCAEWLSSQMTKDGETWFGHWFIGEHRMRAQQVAKAVDAFRRADQLGCRVTTRCNLAAVLAWAGKKDEAFKTYADADAAFPDHVAVLQGLRSAAWEVGEKRSSLKASERLYDLNRRNSTYLTGHIEWLKACGMKREPEELARHLWALSPYLVGRSVMQAAASPPDGMNASARLKPYRGPDAKNDAPAATP